MSEHHPKAGINLNRAFRGKEDAAEAAGDAPEVYRIVQGDRERGMKIYLLHIGELIQGSMDPHMESMLCKLDVARREKVASAKTVQGKAAELGAGLLLQRAVQDWRREKLVDNPEGGPGESGEMARKIVLPKQSPQIRRCTVSDLLAELAEPLSLTYRYGEKGKPYLENLPLFFSLSHSGEYVLCAVSRRELGADIQKIQPADELKLAKRFFSESECRILEGCESHRERQRLFFGFWTRKEAYGKLTGEGLAAAIREDMQSAEGKRGVEWVDISPPDGYALAICRLTG